VLSTVAFAELLDGLHDDHPVDLTVLRGNEPRSVQIARIASGTRA
jgi:hypothetical protein